jgi:hypothetical protein
MLVYLQTRPDGCPLIYDLKQLVVRHNRIIARNLHELVKAEQYDPYMPNDWIYHKDWNEKDVLNYVGNYSDSLRKEDENEPYDFGGVFSNLDDYR